jgi:lipopolysaccharide export system permease protein
MNLIISRGVKPFLVIELFSLNLAWMLALSVPMAVLVAVLMVFGRLASDNEITASRSCGISFVRLLIPMLGGAFIITLIMIWFSNKVLPESNHRARMLLTDITRKKPTWALEENIFLDHFDGYSIKVRTIARKTSEITDIIVIQTINAERIVTANSGKMFFSEDNSTLMLELENGEILEVEKDQNGGISRTKFIRQTIAIPGASSEIERSSEGNRGDREMTVAMMRNRNANRQENVDNSIIRADSLIQSAMNRLFSDPNEIIRSISIPYGRAANVIYNYNNDILGKLTFQYNTAKNYKREINSMDVEIQKKFSIPAACLAFVLMGAPLGSIARKGGFATGIGLSLFFFIIYWAFLILGEQMADKGIIPAIWAMWMPNIIVGGAGIFLSLAFVKQTAVMSSIDAIRSFITPARKR